MTRFLPRVLAEIGNSLLNEETERLFAYHQATKHTYHSVRMNARSLDWSNQPNPFRTYEGAEIIALPAEPEFPEAGTFETIAKLADNARPHTEEGAENQGQRHLDLNWLSKLLWHSMAISAWKKAPGSGGRYSLRVNPSSGNLHPTETYLAARDFAGAADGLYHYRADRHALEVRGRGGWTRHLAEALDIPWATESQLIIGLTSIFWREAWKYRDRAYRYCCHDLGHAMMSLLLAARAMGLAGGVIAHFSDIRLVRTLGLMDGDEAPMAFLVFPNGKPPEQFPAPAELSATGIPNELSPEEIPYELLMGMHRSTILPEPAGPLPRAAILDSRVQGARPSLDEASDKKIRDAALGMTVRRRRSALDFNADTPSMERGEVEQLLDFATRDWRADWRGNFDGETAWNERGADFIQTYLYIHRVKGCDPGVYRWRSASRKLEQLHPGDVQRVAAYLSLEQSLAGNACLAISMIADLERAARVFGNRGYRYAYFEAGAIGQRLYVGAQALGWGATGIGAFYDDDVHRYLGFLEEGESSVSASVAAAERAALVLFGSPASRAAAQEHVQQAGVSGGAILNDETNADERASPRKDPSTLPRQVIYHFAIGRPVADPRIEA